LRIYICNKIILKGSILWQFKMLQNWRKQNCAWLFSGSKLIIVKLWKKDLRNLFKVNDESIVFIFRSFLCSKCFFFRSLLLDFRWALFLLECKFVKSYYIFQDVCWVINKSQSNKFLLWHNLAWDDVTKCLLSVLIFLCSSFCSWFYYCRTIIFSKK